MKISEVKVWFGIVNINYNNDVYQLSSDDPETIKNKIPMEIFLKDYESIGEALDMLYKYDNEYRAQKECSP